MRPRDWSAAGFGQDPVPGDPDLVRRGGQRYVEMAQTIERTARGLRSLGLEGTVSEAASALAETANTVADDISRAQTRYRTTGDALVGYAEKLRRAQDESSTALQQARSAQADAEDAQVLQRRYLRLAGDAADPTETLRYELLAGDTGSEARGAQTRIAAAHATIVEAQGFRDRAAEEARAAIENTTSADGIGDTWWDDWGADVLAVVTDVAGWVSAVAGILALVVCWIPVIGQALAAALILVAGIAAIVNAIGNVVLAADGERTWTEAAISIVGAALSFVGLGAAARVAGAGAAASRINAAAATEVAARANPFETFDRLTIIQAVRLRPGVLAESERLWRAPVSNLGAGDQVFRLYGDKAAQGGLSWSTSAPSTLLDFRALLGLPSANSAERLAIATVDNLDGYLYSRHALPLNGMPGGAPEHLIDGSTLGEKGLIVIRDSAWTVSP
jgi:hypothetical protein